MHSTLDFAKMAMFERQRDAARAHLAAIARGRLAPIARRIADCCTPTSIRSSIAAALRSVGDTCCPSEQERLARTMRIVYGA